MPSESLKLSEAMVERAEAALPAIQGGLAPGSIRLQAARDILTAALRLDDPETVERVAKELWRQRGYPEPYDTADEAVQVVLRSSARDVITALLAEPEGVDGG